MRRLTLHTSALNDDEYDLYTSSIQDLALSDSNLSNGRDDTFYEQISLGVREVRAWLRGRYQDTPVNTIDAILKFFSPTLSPTDTLAAGEFFAVLRLVLHAQSGKAVDRNLVFVQAHPRSPNPSNHRSSAEAQRRSIDSSALSIASEPPLSAPNPFTGQQPPLHPSQRQDAPKHIHSPNNPFVARSKSITTRSENGSSRLPPLPPRKPSAPLPPPRHTSGSSLKSPRTITTATDHAPSIAQPHLQPHQHHPPPPPPPKPKPVTHVTSPLIKRSLQASKVAQTIKQVEDERGRERVLQVLRSSAAGSGGSARGNDSVSRSPAKKALASLPLSVEAKSDSSASWSGGDERERPPLPRRPRQLHATSPSMSASSLEQVALAVVPSGSRSHPATPFLHSPFESPTHSPRPSLDSPSLPPPTHPDRKSHQPYQTLSSPQDKNYSPYSASTSPSRNPESFDAVYGPNRRSSVSSLDTPISPTTSDTFPEQAKVLRSKSLHQYKPYIPPPPPPARRKRPESVQSLTNGQAFFGVGQSNDSNNALKNSMTLSPSKAPRRASYSSSFGGSVASAPASTSLGGHGGGGGTDAIQRKLAELQLKAENALPKLEAAMYKAEAGISRRGFIQGSPSRGRERSNGRLENGGQDREGLMSGYDEDQYGDRGGSDGEMVERNGLSVDSGDESCLRGRKEDKKGSEIDRDNLKWPAGEGWKEL